MVRNPDESAGTRFSGLMGLGKRRLGKRKPISALVWAPLVLLVAMLTLAVRPTQAQAPGTGPVLAMVVDTSGSMGSVITSVKACIADIIAKVRVSTNPPSQYVLVDYRDLSDYPPDGNIPFSTSDPDAYLAQVNAMFASGGGDTPEAGHRAVLEGVNRIRAFRAGSPSTTGEIDQIFMFTDASNHPLPAFPDTPEGRVESAKSIFATAASNNIRIYPVLIGSGTVAPGRGVTSVNNNGQPIGGISPFVVEIPEYTALAGRLPGQLSNGSTVFAVGSVSNLGGICLRLEKVARGGLRTVIRRRGIFSSSSGSSVRPLGTPTTGTEDIPFVVDSSTTSLLASVIADSLTDAQLIRPSGSPVVAGDAGVTIDIFATGAFISVENPEAGNWIFRITGSGAFDAAVEVNSPVGFASAAFVDAGGNPIPGNPAANRPANLRVQLTGPIDSSTVTFLLVDETGLPITLDPALTLTESAPGSGLFTGTFIPPNQPFRILVRGETTDESLFQRLFDPLFTPQNVTVAIVGSAPTTVNSGGSVNITYTVTNVGGTTATFNVGATTSLGTVTVDPTSVTLDPGASTNVVATLTVPADAPQGTPITVVFTVTNAADPTSTNSATTNLTVFAVTVPPAPSDLAEVPGTRTSRSVTLTWTDNSSGTGQETVFQFLRIGPGTAQTFINLPPDTTTFTDISVAPNTLYTYEVRAINVAGPSPFSNQISVFTPPAPPTDLGFRPITREEILLTFTPQPGAAALIVERLCEGDEGFVQIAVIPPTSTNFVVQLPRDPDTGRLRVCAFRLRARGAGGDSEATTAVLVPSSTRGRLSVDRTRLVYNLSNGVTQQTLRVTIANTGLDPLPVTLTQPIGRVGGAQVFSPHFHITGLISVSGRRQETRVPVSGFGAITFELQPGERRIVELRFRPAPNAVGFVGRGSYSAFLPVFSAAATSPLRITLTGKVKNNRFATPLGGFVPPISSLPEIQAL